VRIARSGDMTSAATVMAQNVRPRTISMAREIDQLSDALRKEADVSRHRDDVAYRRTLGIMAALLALGGSVACTYVRHQVRLLGRSLERIQACWCQQPGLGGKAGLRMNSHKSKRGASFVSRHTLSCFRVIFTSMSGRVGMLIGEFVGVEGAVLDCVYQKLAGRAGPQT
jgi:hypothetical protein